MSDLQGRRIRGEEDSGRRRPWVWIVLGLILLLLLVVLIPFACQALTGGSGQRNPGQGAQGDGQAEKEAENKQADNAQARNKQADKAQADDARAGNKQADDGGGTEGGSGERADSGETRVAVTRLSARDQSGSGASVTVPAATLEGTEGWLAVRANDGGEPGEVLGYSPLRAGTNNDVEVELDLPVDSSRRLYTTVHQESPADGKFTFPADDPTATRGGQAAVEPIYYTVDDGASGQGSAGIRDDELPESGGVPPGALLAAGALLLASSVAGFSLALRRGSEIGR